ncbi:DUF3883 domain-containing protein [Klebsiella pneumoniae]|uniref:DUF3883 domain-containing protein n=1 Tax=Klebsiella pneumoniae TaxID=573 RepID=UPI00296E4EA6|nr:DUF3883 domain-containing protein [Klebsiella pneumoniae]
MGSCAAPSAKGDDKFITTDYLQQCPFLVSHNELEFSKEAGDQFHLYRVFQFRDGPRLFTLPGDLSQHVHLKPTGTVANSRW